MDNTCAVIEDALKSVINWRAIDFEKPAIGSIDDIAELMTYVITKYYEAYSDDSIIRGVKKREHLEIELNSNDLTVHYFKTIICRSFEYSTKIQQKIESISINIDSCFNDVTNGKYYIDGSQGNYTYGKDNNGFNNDPINFFDDGINYINKVKTWGDNMNSISNQYVAEHGIKHATLGNLLEDMYNGLNFVKYSEYKKIRNFGAELVYITFYYFLKGILAIIKKIIIEATKIVDAADKYKFDQYGRSIDMLQRVMMSNLTDYANISVGGYGIKKTSAKLEEPEKIDRVDLYRVDGGGKNINNKEKFEPNTFIIYFTGYVDEDSTMDNYSPKKLIIDYNL